MKFKSAISGDHCKSLQVTTREAVYVERNIKARSFNRYCSTQTISVAHSESVSVALRAQHAMRMRHIMICRLSRSAMLFHII
jgi:hypothetical protein